MPSRSLIARIRSLLICSLLTAVTLVALVVPGSAASVFALDKTAQKITGAPSELVVPPNSQTSYLYASDGKTLITTFYEQNRRDVPLASVAPVMRQAIIASEDERFYSHGGVDLRSVVRALVANQTSGGVSQGASTLTMQYVRNVIKNDPDLTTEQRRAATADSLVRKIGEARYALALERRMSKDEILERYLNISYFGAGAYGIWAAAKIYFNTTPDKLTLPQAAMIAGLVQSPDAYNPISGDKKSAKERRDRAIDIMVRNQMVDQATADRTKAQPIALRQSPTPNGCAAVPANHNNWAYFCDYFQRWWDGQKAFGATVQDRQAALERGGYSIVTTMDVKASAAALAQSLSVYGYGNPRAMPIAVVQPGTGNVLALSVNRRYSLSANPRGRKYPNTVDPLITGGEGIYGYQTGSTYKMFTMLAALEAGRSLDTGFVAPSPLRTNYPVSSGNCVPVYCPVNDNPAWMDGYRTMWDGFGRSVNTYFVWLEQQIGSDKAVAMAKKLGIKFSAPSDRDYSNNGADQWGAFTLGVVQTTPLELANAYATVASEGMYCQPKPASAVTDPKGQTIAVAAPSCKRVIEPDVARAATDAARCPVGQQSYYNRCNGGTANSVSEILGGRPVAGKTGSSQENATETFVGFTPQVAAAGVAANPNDPTDAVGSGIALSVDEAVARTLAAVLLGQPARAFNPPSSAVAGTGDRSGVDPNARARNPATGNTGQRNANNRRRGRG
jgi:membrane peptidoglycan carboxypeptidase